MSGADVVAFDLALPDGWYPMPLRDASWAQLLAAEIGSEESSATLAEMLRSTQSGIETFADARTRAAVFVEFPGAGKVSGVLVFGLVAVTALGDPDTLEAGLREPVTADGSLPYGTQIWRDTVDAGVLVGAHQLLAHPEGGVLEERVVMTVYPDDAAQAVQVVASANGLGAFPDMASSIQAICATLRVEKASS